MSSMAMAVGGGGMVSIGMSFHFGSTFGGSMYPASEMAGHSRYCSLCGLDPPTRTYAPSHFSISTQRSSITDSSRPDAATL